ncbi:sugar ABC transporter substrate-binding protein [Glutamicibacter sp. MNS18]|uniref:ABC transporter substrate-binding protein n=1 Tax=Glutamicibacter sp. MNS18 TaxID=2989817 RepID=UPI002236A89D|nr:sugar ABC transporter substrate-binding protein [Glutamicibacter sp. MNS18]MCW4466399.1 sugar ABC transporter substrate-binding protein [Glutamicibacter sp. MNS18]
MTSTTKQLRRRATRTLAFGAITALALTGCSVSADRAPVSNTIDYWLWDTSQLPSYQKCADQFEEANPDLKVNITQYGWNDYWGKLTASFIAGTGPDVFTNHVTQYPQFVSLDVLAPLDDFEAINEVDQQAFQEGLTELWTGSDGHQYGMPKDWDTIAVFYNEELFKEAGITAQELSSSAWNPQDGGSFEQLLAHLTVDANGVRGDEPGFDKSRIKIYGMGLSEAGGGQNGQGQWAGFAATNGWKATNQPLWGDSYNYDDPRLHETLDWYFGLVDKGYVPAYGQFNSSDGTLGQLTSGAVAMVTDGAWMNSAYASSERPISTARLPKGPDGTSKSPINGLADSVVKSSDNPEAASKWVAHMASEQCQRTVAENGVVFPARKDATDITSEVYASLGLNPESFTDPIDDGNTFYLAVTDHGADVIALLGPAFEDLWANRTPASGLTRTNEAVNKIFAK